MRCAQTICLTCNWVTHRNDVFPDPGRFDPDRWLDGGKLDHLKESFNPFGVGPRACIGSKCVMGLRDEVHGL
jgi:cytochrome P450